MEKSRMNGLGLSTSSKAAKGPVEFKTNLGNMGATVKPLKPSNNPGAMTSPSTQGPTQRITKRQ
jgi:hypothetical protein